MEIYYELLSVNTAKPSQELIAHLQTFKAVKPLATLAKKIEKL